MARHAASLYGSLCSPLHTLHGYMVTLSVPNLNTASRWSGGCGSSRLPTLPATSSYSGGHPGHGCNSARRCPLVNFMRCCPFVFLSRRSNIRRGFLRSMDAAHDMTPHGESADGTTWVMSTWVMGMPSFPSLSHVARLACKPRGILAFPCIAHIRGGGYTDARRLILGIDTRSWKIPLTR